MLKETGDGYYYKMAIHYLRSNSQYYEWQNIDYVFHRLIKGMKSDGPQ